MGEGLADGFQRIYKCHVLSISRKQKPVLFPYTISGVQLEHVRPHPYSGVGPYPLTSDLKWGPNLDISIPKAQRTLNLLRWNLYSCSSGPKELAYKTLVQPELEYAGIKSLGSSSGKSRPTYRERLPDLSQVSMTVQSLSPISWPALGGAVCRNADWSHVSVCSTRR